MLLLFHGYRQRMFCITQIKPGKIDGTISPGLTGHVFDNLLYNKAHSNLKTAATYAGGFKIISTN